MVTLSMAPTDLSYRGLMHRADIAAEADKTGVVMLKIVYTDSCLLENNLFEFEYELMLVLKECVAAADSNRLVNAGIQIVRGFCKDLVYGHG